MNLTGLPRVVVADDHISARKLIARVLQPGHRIVATVDDAPGLLEAEARLHPDLLIVDVDMPGRSGLDAIRDLRARNCRAAIVVVTVDENPDLAVRALGVGAQAFVIKSHMAQDLPAAAAAALQGMPFVSPRIPGGSASCAPTAWGCSLWRIPTASTTRGGRWRTRTIST